MSDAIPSNNDEHRCSACPSAVETDLFVMSKGGFARAMLARFGLRWWIGILLLLIAGAVVAACVADWRWIVVALMLALIITPMAAAFLYFSFGLRRECYINILPHSAIISPKGIKVVINVPAERPESDGEEQEEAAPLPLRTYHETFPSRCFGGYTVDRTGITIEIKTPGRGFIRLPYSAFASPDLFASAVGFITEFERENKQTTTIK